MRQIKFRYWIPRSKEMRYDFELGDGDDGYITTDDQGLVYSGDVVWMQYTGLKDVSGREIYEGDILSFYDGEEILEVQWREDFASFGGVITLVLDDYGPDNKITYYSPENCVHRGMDVLSDDNVEIIGNIFESPDLLKQLSAA